jgi:hypothetical protein
MIPLTGEQLQAARKAAADAIDIVCIVGASGCVIVFALVCALVLLAQ